MPDLEDPTLCFIVKSEELDLDFEMTVPVKITQGYTFHGLLASFAAAVPSEISASEKQAANVKCFEDVLQKALSLRDERHAFYAQVQTNFDRMADTLQRMKRDYYREVDHLRAQISLSKRDPDFQHDNVFFFDPTTYQIPAWETVVEQLDDRRLQRELLVEQGGNSIRNVPVHMLCQNCRNRFQLDPIHSMDGATQTEVPSRGDSLHETIQSKSTLQGECSTNDDAAALESFKAAEQHDELGYPDKDQLESCEEKKEQSHPGDRKHLVELSNQATQTDPMAQRALNASGTCSCEISSRPSQDSADSVQPQDLRGKAMADSQSDLVGLGGDFPPRLPTATVEGQVPSTDSKLSSAGEGVHTQAVDAKASKWAAHFMKALVHSSRSALAHDAAIGTGQRCFDAWKAHVASHVVARRHSTSKKTASKLVKRQLAAFEAHVRRMAFIGWRQVALGKVSRPCSSQQTPGTKALESIGEHGKPSPGQPTSRNKALGARPTSEPSGCSSSNIRNRITEPGCKLETDAEDVCRPSSEPTLAARGEQRLRNLQPTGLNDTSEESGHEGVPSSIETTSTDSRTPLRQQFWGADDVEEWRSQRRIAVVEDSKLRAADQMAKTYARRGASVPHVARNGATSLQQRVPMHLRLQNLSVDVCVSNPRWSPLHTPQESPHQEFNMFDRHSKQPLKQGMEKSRLSQVASLPAFGSAAQRSPTQSPPPLLGRCGRALPAAKKSLARLPYASN